MRAQSGCPGTCSGRGIGRADLAEVEELKNTLGGTVNDVISAARARTRCATLPARFFSAKLPTSPCRSTARMLASPVRAPVHLPAQLALHITQFGEDEP